MSLPSADEKQYRLLFQNIRGVATTNTSTPTKTYAICVANMVLSGKEVLVVGRKLHHFVHVRCTVNFSLNASISEQGRIAEFENSH